MSLICVPYRELELSSVFETTEGEGLGLHHPDLICRARPHGPSPSPKPPLCRSSRVLQHLHLSRFTDLLIGTVFTICPCDLWSTQITHSAMPAPEHLSSGEPHSVLFCPLKFPFVLDPNSSLPLLRLSRGIHQPAISLSARHTLQPAKGTSEAYYSTGILIRALGCALMIFSCDSLK